MLLISRDIPPSDFKNSDARNNERRRPSLQTALGSRSAAMLHTASVQLPALVAQAVLKNEKRKKREKNVKKGTEKKKGRRQRQQRQRRENGRDKIDDRRFADTCQTVDNSCHSFGSQRQCRF
jgi:hypothetical protein